MLKEFLAEPEVKVEEEKVTDQHFEQMEEVLEFMWRMC